MRERAEALDRDDPLAGWRDEFLLPDPELIYLDGNSLGRTPKRTVEALRTVVEEQWAGDLITSWWEHGWLDMPLTVGDELAPLLGAQPGEVAVHDSTTVCLFQLVNVALDLTGGSVIAVADTEFPTDRYVTEGIARLRPGVTVRRGLDDLAGVDVVVRSLVDYRTAELQRSRRRDGPRSGRRCRHRLGSVARRRCRRDRPDGSRCRFGSGLHVQVPQWRAGVAGVHVRSALRSRTTSSSRSGDGSANAISSRWTIRSTPAPASVGCSTAPPAVLGLVAARCGIEVSAAAGITDIAAKARGLSGFAIDLAATSA